MKTLIINGSPKLNDSNSEILVNKLNHYLNTDTIQINIKNYKEDFTDVINNYETIIFVFPLYVDGIPSHLLEALNNLNIKENTNIYTIVNCGFPESAHTKQGLDLIRNYSIHKNLNYKGGLGIGGCGGLNGMSKNKLLKFTTKSINKNIEELSEFILNNDPYENTFITTNIPDSIYRLIGNLSWKKQINEID